MQSGEEQDTSVQSRAISLQPLPFSKTIGLERNQSHAPWLPCEKEALSRLPSEAEDNAMAQIKNLSALPMQAIPLWKRDGCKRSPRHDQSQLPSQIEPQFGFVSPAAFQTDCSLCTSVESVIGAKLHCHPEKRIPSKSYPALMLENSNDAIEQANAQDMSALAESQSNSTASVQMHRDQYNAIVRNISNKENRIRALRNSLLIALCAVVVLAVVSLGGSLLALRLTKELFVNDDNELVGSNKEEVVTLRPKSFSTLSDLPGQDLAFLENIDSITMRIKSELHHYSVLGFIWHNVSYMVLETTRDRDVIIAGGKAFVRDRATSRVFHATTPASEPQCGRRLAHMDSKTRVPRKYSWLELLAKYQSETQRPLANRERLLNERVGEYLTDLYEWFGAVISSEVSAREAKQDASKALNDAYCAYNVRGLECAAYENAQSPQPPALSEGGLNKFVLLDGSEIVLLYLDLSDWTLASKISSQDRVARSKLASGVVLDPNDDTGSAIRVTESRGSMLFTYQMMHPGVLPERYNLSQATGNLALAEAVLESMSYESHKGECRTVNIGIAEEKRTSDKSVAFDCDEGTYTWSIGGWRVQASVDGAIHALVFSDVAENASDEEFTKSIRYRVLSVSDGADARANFKLNQAFLKDSIFTGCSQPIDIARRLLPAAVLPNTNWCGPGQCPACGDNYCLDSFSGDWACRRHDTCSKISHLFTFPILACSCDKDLYDNTRGDSAASSVIAGIYGSWGWYPCIAREATCADWGWVQSGRRRRWGWSYWGIRGSRPCDKWHYVNKYATRRRIQRFEYASLPNGWQVNSKYNWPNCKNNAKDIDLGNPFGL